jgi:hypothetical protein
VTPHPDSVDGVPPGARPHALLFNAVADVLILVAARGPRNEVYVRRVGDPAYSHIGPAGSDESIETVVTASAAPVVYLHVVRQTPHGEGFFQDFVGILRVDLHDQSRTGQVDILPEGATGHVTRLLGASAEGKLLYCTLGLRRHLGATKGTIEHAVGRVDVDTGRTTVIDRLHHTFF